MRPTVARRWPSVPHVARTQFIAAPGHGGKGGDELDHDARRRSQRDDDLLVIDGEPAERLLLREVQVPEHPVPGADRYAEKRVHRRVVGREAEGSLILTEPILKPPGIGGGSEATGVWTECQHSGNDRTSC